MFWFGSAIAQRFQFGRVNFLSDVRLRRLEPGRDSHAVCRLRFFFRMQEGLLEELAGAYHANSIDLIAVGLEQ